MSINVTKQIFERFIDSIIEHLHNFIKENGTTEISRPYESIVFYMDQIQCDPSQSEETKEFIASLVDPSVLVEQVNISALDALKTLLDNNTSLSEVNIHGDARSLLNGMKQKTDFAMFEDYNQMFREINGNLTVSSPLLTSINGDCEVPVEMFIFALTTTLVQAYVRGLVAGGFLEKLTTYTDLTPLPTDPDVEDPDVDYEDVPVEEEEEEEEEDDEEEDDEEEEEDDEEEEEEEEEDDDGKDDIPIVDDPDDETDDSEDSEAPKFDKYIEKFFNRYGFGIIITFIILMLVLFV